MLLVLESAFSKGQRIATITTSIFQGQELMSFDINILDISSNLYLYNWVSHALCNISRTPRYALEDESTTLVVYPQLLQT